MGQPFSQVKLGYSQFTPAHTQRILCRLQFCGCDRHFAFCLTEVPHALSCKRKSARTHHRRLCTGSLLMLALFWPIPSLAPEENKVGARRRWLDSVFQEVPEPRYPGKEKSVRDEDSHSKSRVLAGHLARVPESAQLPPQDLLVWEEMEDRSGQC